MDFETANKVIDCIIVASEKVIEAMDLACSNIQGNTEKKEFGRPYVQVLADLTIKIMGPITVEFPELREKVYGQGPE